MTGQSQGLEAPTPCPCPAHGEGGGGGGVSRHAEPKTLVCSPLACITIRSTAPHPPSGSDQALHRRRRSPAPPLAPAHCGRTFVLLRSSLASTPSPKNIVTKQAINSEPHWAAKEYAIAGGPAMVWRPRLAPRTTLVRRKGGTPPPGSPAWPAAALPPPQAN